MPNTTDNQATASTPTPEPRDTAPMRDTAKPRRPVVPRRKPWLPPQLEGRVFSGRYRMGTLLGIGGMALIYKAEHIEIQKPVAVKVLHPRYADDPEHARRFLEEARAASRLRHDHIIDITDSGRTEDGYVYFVLEYLEGEDLAKTLREDGPIPWIRVVHIAKQICKALAEAHKNTIIHRDIKPANCFRVTRDNNSDFIKVLDFGIASSTLDTSDPKVKPNKPNTLDQMGTPAFMAPELLRGEAFDHRVDIYALGVLMYQLLTGKLPQRPLPRDQRLPGRPRRAERLRSSASLVQDSPDPDIPEQLEAIIIHAMAHDPELRFFDATEFHDALEQVLVDLTLSNQLVANRLARDPLTWRGDQDPNAAAIASTLTPMATGAVPRNAEASSSFLVTYTPVPNATALAAELAGKPTGHILTPMTTVLVACAIAVLFVFVGLRVVSPRAASELGTSLAGATPRALSTTGEAHAHARRPAVASDIGDADEPESDTTTAALTPETSPITAVIEDTSEDAATRDARVAAKHTHAKPRRATGKLPRRAFDRVYKPAEDAIQQQCWRYTGGMLTSFDVRVAVTPDGAVESVAVTQGSPSLKKCVKSALAELVFPESRRGGTFTRTISQAGS